MIRTWLFFTFGGFFTACYSNAVRRYPLLRNSLKPRKHLGPAAGSAKEPQMHLICTSVACYLGYLAHRYEETSEERVQNLLKKYKHAPRQWAELPKRDHESAAAGDE